MLILMHYMDCELLVTMFPLDRLIREMQHMFHLLGTLSDCVPKDFGFALIEVHSQSSFGCCLGECLNRVVDHAIHSVVGFCMEHDGAVIDESNVYVAFGRHLLALTKILDWGSLSDPRHGVTGGYCIMKVLKH